MPLTIGSKLGPYEIVSSLGVGGMGEVYKARDPRLNRTVAIKVLPESVSSNPELRARFEREARALSAFQHPHICTLYDIGHQDGIDYLVMEHLEGETLAARLERGPLPTDQVLRIGIDLADALDKAHRVGLVHRDLKPGNIILTKGGAKLLDFGLAKEASSALGANAMTAMVTQSQPLTAHGTIVGTFFYMAPEQLEGHDADARADIFAFGTILYEMTTGRRAFEGKTQASIIAAIIASEPKPLQTLVPAAPASLDHVIRTCLAKDPDDRFQSAHDLFLQLRYIANESVTSSMAVQKVHRPWWREWKLAWAVAAVAFLIAAVTGYQAYQAATAPHPVVRAIITPPEKLTFDPSGDFASPATLSPDGNYIVFGAKSADSRKALWVRPVSSISAQRLEGTENASFPFWSADSRNIGFFAGGQVKKVPISGGPATALADAPNARGASWNADNIILYCPNFRGPLFKVSASGGAATPATTLVAGKETTHRWPWFLPDGKHFLYYATNHDVASDVSGIFLGTLDGNSKLIMPNASAGAYANGYLLFRVQNALMAQRMDSSGTLSGDPTMLVDRIAYDPGVWRMIFSASTSGALLYQQGAGTSGSHLNWYDRSGKQQATLGEQTHYRDPRISPDGKRVAVCMGDPNWAIWVLDIARGIKTRLSFGNGTAIAPSWSADGKWIFYSLNDTGVSGGSSGAAHFGTSIHRIATDGSGQDETLLPAKADNSYIAPEITPDGRYLQFLGSSGPVGASIQLLDLKGDRTLTKVIAPSNPQGNITDAHLSPDGKWIAYASTESGPEEIYITSFPRAEGKWQVSSGGAGSPRWQRNGKRLVFQNSRNDFVSVDVTATGGRLQLGIPKILFNIATVGDGAPFDITPDGERLLANVGDSDAASAPLVYVLNWPEELKKK
jgi:eukaryotic-like serine/threonine-protein kinase